MEVTYDKHLNKAFIERAVESGWSAEIGPWGYSESSERTVILTKPLPQLGGEVLLWMVCRNLGVSSGLIDEADVQANPDLGWHTAVEAWHAREGGGTINLRPNMKDVLEQGLDDDFWMKLALTCDSCGQIVTKVNHVAFANKACDSCFPETKKQMETPGWDA